PRRRRPGRAMTAPSRYRGQPGSEGTGTGEIHLGDAPGQAGQDHVSPGENEVRAAFAAVAQERAALAARLRDQLSPVLALLEGRPAVVRLLDFSRDEVPAFLR